LNKTIIKLIADRLEIGKKQYANEVDINDGREWVQEALEETLDACVYISAKLLQIKQKVDNENKSNNNKKSI